MEDTRGGSGVTATDRGKTGGDRVDGRERAILVGAAVKGERALWSLDDSLDELERLAMAAGAQVVGRISQRLQRHSRSYLGRGKLQELVETIGETGATLVITDDELNPDQQRNLERLLDVKLLDRTALILDVFARHASTREGRLQVELAQYEYLLPRLAGRWPHLERLGGGIGTRGPGETQLETDRRIIHRKIQRLKGQLQEVRRHRSLYRRRRRDSGTPVASLVGYTNAGKSTLLNALSKAGVTTQDQPFSTLDPVTRRVPLPDGTPLLLTDTVGFIHKLSPRLVAAFRATLEELEEASVILHVVDLTQPRAAEQAEVVDGVLDDLGVEGKPRVLVLNKVDLLVDAGEEVDWADGRVVSRVERGGVAGGDRGERGGAGGYPAVVVSAGRGWGLGELVEAVEGVVRGRAGREPVGAGNLTSH